VQSGESPAVDDQTREMDELKDRNTALQEQIKEYSQTIIEERRVSKEELRNPNTSKRGEGRKERWWWWWWLGVGWGGGGRMVNTRK
jgi:hypothetical protein